MSNLSKQQILDMIKLLSALQAWTITNANLPDYLADGIIDSIGILSKELLGDGQGTDVHNQQ